MTVLVWLMAIVASIIGALGVILLVIGVLFTLPYAFAVNAHLYGQFKQLTQSATSHNRITSSVPRQARPGLASTYCYRMLYMRIVLAYTHLKRKRG